MPIKLTNSQLKIISLAVFVAAVSLCITVLYFRQTFPEANLNLRVNRADSEAIALKFMAGRGLHLDGYHHATAFTYDDNAKLYLERTQGLDKTNELTAGPIHLWRWSHRWFKPEQNEEFSADVTPSGQVVRFGHSMPESQPGASLATSSARLIAEHFLSAVMNRDIGDLEFLQSASTKRPARIDYYFTWKQRSVDLGEGSLRLAVWVNGDQVVGYSEFVNVPEQWERDYEKLRSRNNTAQFVDGVFFSLLGLAMLITLVVRLRHHDVPLRMAFGFGLAAALLYLLSQLNTFSLAQFSYSTTESYSSFITGYLTVSILRALGVGFSIFIVVAGSEPVYREGFPAMVSMRRYFAWNGLRTRSFLMANVVGIALAFLFFAYQTVFYFCAKKLGAWAPADIPFTNELNTWLPWTGILFTGFFPAVSEEMQFRAFAIPFLGKLVRSLPLAVILSAFNWGFLHSTYPNQPFYIRGLEVGIGGILIGFIMLRFGIVATLIWHYSVDALYSAFVLLRSPNHYFMISGAITAGLMLVPLAVALAAYFYTGTFSDESALTNAQEGLSRLPKSESVERLPSEIAYQPLSTKFLQYAGILTAVFIAVAFVPVYRFGESVKLQITSQEAIRAADAYLVRQNIDPARYRHVSFLMSDVDETALLYMLEHRRSLKDADRIFRRATQPIAWVVRYFRPLESGEHRVYIDATNGQFIDHRREIDESAPGASLSAANALGVAQNALSEHGYKVADFDLQDSRAEKRNARQDYTFVWQAKAGDPRNVEDERYRTQVRIAGDQVIAVSDSFQPPEAWLREQQKTNLADALMLVLVAAAILALFGRALFLFVVHLRQGRLAWRTASPVALALAVVSALSECNSLPNVEQGYSTTIPLQTFWLETALRLVFDPLFVALATWALVAFALSMHPKAEHILERPARALWGRDALVAIIFCLAAVGALGKIGALMAAKVPRLASFDLEMVPQYVDTWSPALAYFFGAVIASVLFSAALGVLIPIFQSAWRRWGWLICGMAFLFAVLSALSISHSISDFLVAWAMSAVSFAAITALVAWILTTFFRDNMLAYPVTIFCLGLAHPIMQLLSQPPKFYQWNGVFLLLLAILTLFWVLFPSTFARRTITGDGSYLPLE